MADRRRTELGPSARACGACGSPDTVLVRSRAARSGWQRVDPRWRADERQYDKCRACGTRTVIRQRTTLGDPSGPPTGRHAAVLVDVELPAGESPRPRWRTALLELLLLAIVVFDGWAAVSWASAGDIGRWPALVCAAISLVFAVLLVLDARRHWPRRR